MKRICVFCGSKAGADPRYAALAAEMGRAAAAAGLGLVFGGGRVGLMGIVADAALAAGGEVIGVIPKALAEREVEHQGLTETRVVGSMHERKAIMADLSDGFVALPGGAGTLEEIFEQWTWAQLSIHAKPCAVLNAFGYYDPLQAMVETMTGEGFLSAEHAALFGFVTSPAGAIADLTARASAAAPSDGGWGGAPGGQAGDRLLP